MLDTHVLLWALMEPSRIPPGVVVQIEQRSVAVVVSAASAWEIATKHRLGKLTSAAAAVQAYDSHLDRLGAVELPVSGRHALLAGGLTWDHRDPFDRVLAAQAISESLTLVTADEAFATLPGVRLLWH